MFFFPAQREIFFLLNSSNGSVLGEVLELRAGSVFCEAIEGSPVH